MSLQAFLILALFTSRISCDCVRYTFNEDYEDLFDQSGVCGGMEFWDLGYYNGTDVMGKNEKSESFISPRAAFSCVSSFMFTMESGGTVEVNIFMVAPDRLDQINIIANQYVVNGNDGVVGTAMILGMDPNFERGWHTLRIKLTGNGIYQGYVTIMGMASRNSIVLVDSFRYVPPNMDENLCRLYEEDIITTEPPVTTAQPPVTTTQPPVTTTQPLVTTTQQSVTTTQPPTVPETTTRPPAIITRPPARPESRPPITVNVKVGVNVDLYKH